MSTIYLASFLATVAVLHCTLLDSSLSKRVLKFHVATVSLVSPAGVNSWPACLVKRRCLDHLL